MFLLHQNSNVIIHRNWKQNLKFHIETQKSGDNTNNSDWLKNGRESTFLILSYTPELFVIRQHGIDRKIYTDEWTRTEDPERIKFLIFLTKKLKIYTGEKKHFQQMVLIKLYTYM